MSPPMCSSAIQTLRRYLDRYLCNCFKNSAKNPSQEKNKDSDTITLPGSDTLASITAEFTEEFSVELADIVAHVKTNGCRGELRHHEASGFSARTLPEAIPVKIMNVAKGEKKLQHNLQKSQVIVTENVPVSAVDSRSCNSEVIIAENLDAAPVPTSDQKPLNNACNDACNVAYNDSTVTTTDGLAKALAHVDTQEVQEVRVSDGETYDIISHSDFTDSDDASEHVQSMPVESQSVI